MRDQATTDRPGGERQAGWQACRASVLVLAVLAAATPAAALALAGPDGANIVNSGSTNTAGYRIKIWSDGSGQLILQSRGGSPASAPKSFTVPQATAKKFFADVRAARDGKASSEPCMKSASFGTSTHVTWHGWTSPDLDCPPAGPLATALAADVDAIRKASGADSAMPLHRGLIPHR